MTADEVMALIRASDKPFYCYILKRPCGEPFYVGIGTKRRILDHEIFAKRPNLKSHKLAVIRTIWRAKQRVEYEISGWFGDREQAERAECALILAIGRRDLGTGTLTNITDGGEGAPNISADSRKARSEKCAAVWARRKQDGATCSHLHTPEVKAKSLASRRNSRKPRKPPVFTRKPGRQSIESRRLLSEQMKADPVSRRPGVGERISQALTGSRNLKNATPVTIDGTAYPSIRDAAAALGIDRGTVARWQANPEKPRGRWPKESLK